MSSDLAELSSITSSVEELTARVVGIADRRAGEDPEDRMADQLYEVERVLRQALTRLRRVVR